MRIAIIVGSHRLGSESTRVGVFLASALHRLDATVDVDTIDLAGNPLPLWDESAWQPDSALVTAWKPFRDRLRKADGLVVVTPEWAGTVPPGVKNLLLLAGAKEVGHKPGLIVAVSSGRGGAYPVAELRVSGTKNNRLLWIPEQVLVQDVGEVLHGNEPAGDRDAWLRRRIDFALGILLAYTRALRPVRESGITDHPDFPYGM
jgi:NAD(P)H-dependent FMN reductase